METYGRDDMIEIGLALVPLVVITLITWRVVWPPWKLVAKLIAQPIVYALLVILAACGQRDASLARSIGISSDPGAACGGVITQSSAIDKAPLAKPGYLQSYVDPAFGSVITRITGDPGESIPNIGGTWPEVCRNNYMKYQSWNADMTLIHLSWGCSLFLDGATYEPALTASTPGRVRWHPTDARWMIYLNDSELGRWDPRTGAREVIDTFSEYSGLTYELEGNLSHDGDWLAPHGQGPDGTNVTFAYNISTGTKYPVIETPTPLDWVTISPSGDYVIVNANWCNDPTGGTSTDRLKFFHSRTGEPVAEANCGYGLPSHQDLGFDQNGDEVIVGIAKSGEWAWNHTIMRRIRDDAMRPVGPAGTHTTVRNIRRPGWAYLQAHTPPYEGEVVAVQLTWDTPPVIERLAAIPNNDGDYSAQNYGSVSPDGMKFIVGSNWGAASGRPVQSYIVDITELCH